MGALTKSANPGILYMGTTGKWGAGDLPSIVMSPWLLNVRMNPNLAKLSPPVHPRVCPLTNSFSITSHGARRPETFPKTAIHCHLLPFSSRKTAKPDAAVYIPLRAFVRDLVKLVSLVY